MPESNHGPSLSFEAQAQRELAAFLRATRNLAGQNGMPQAGDAWFHAMKSVECQDTDRERFFRRVAILAISQLLTSSAVPVRTRKPKPARVDGELAASRTAA